MSEKRIFRKSSVLLAFALLFSLSLALGFAKPQNVLASETQSTRTATQAEEVSIAIENLALTQEDGATWTGQLTEESASVPFIEGMSAMDVLETYAETAGFEVLSTEHAYGQMIDSIAGVDSSSLLDGASWASWMFTVNGEDALASAKQTIVSAGDALTFSFHIGFPDIEVSVENTVYSVSQGAPWEGHLEELEYAGTYFYSLPESKDVNALSVFESYAAQNGFAYEIADSSFGQYISEIEGLDLETEVSGAKWPGWLFYVNGEYVETALADTILEPGDHLSFAFTLTWEESEETTETTIEETTSTETAESSTSQMPSEESSETSTEAPSSNKADSYWPSFRQNDANNAYVEELLFEASTPENTSLLWSQTFPMASWSNYPSQGIIVEDSLLLIHEERLVKIQLATGEITDEVEILRGQGYASSSPLYADGKVFVSLDSGAVQAIDYETFTIVWTSESSYKGQAQNPLSYVETEDEKALVITSTYNPSGEGSLVARDAHTGAIVWEVASENGHYFSGGLVHDKYYLAGGEDGKVKSYALADGSVMDALDTSAKINSSLVKDETSGQIYVINSLGHLYAFTVDEMGQFQIVQHTTLGKAVSATPVVSEEYVFIPSMNEFFVLAKENFAFVSQIAIPGYGQGSPLVIKTENGLEVFFTVNQMPGALYSFRFEDGQASEVREVFTPDENAQNYGLASPIVSENGVLIYRNDSATVFALQLALVEAEEESTNTSSSVSSESSETTSSSESSESSQTTSSADSSESTSVSTMETTEEQTSTSASLESSKSDTEETSNTSDEDSEIPATGESLSAIFFATPLLSAAILLMLTKKSKEEKK